MKLTILAEELLLELSPVEVYNKYYNGINYRTYRAIIKADPQTVVSNITTGYNPVDDDIIRIGKYSKLLLKLYSDRVLKLEDLGKVNEYLTYAYKYHVPLDIGKITSISDVYNSVKKYMNVDTKDLNVIMDSLSRDEDYKVLHNGEDWLILQPLTEKGACYLGVNTQWCTTYGPYSLTKEYRDRTNYFLRYNKQGPLYILIDKSNHEHKFQFHFESKQFMDTSDHSVSTPTIFEEYPEIKNFFFPSFVKDVSAEQINAEIKHIGSLSMDDAKTLIGKLLNIEGDGGNILAKAIAGVDVDRVNVLIKDNNLKDDVDVNSNYITFKLKKLEDNVLMVKDVISNLYYENQNSWENVYNEQDGLIDDWEKYLEPILKEYYDDDEDLIRHDLGYPDYISFSGKYLKEFSKDEDIRSAYRSEMATKSEENYSSEIQQAIDDIKKYIDVDYEDVTINVVEFIQYLIKNEVKSIDNNLDYILDRYIDGTNINIDDSYYVNYTISYPTYQDIHNDVSKYFNEIIEDANVGPECFKLREKFNDIYNRIFKNNPVYENEHVYIRINDLHVDCENGMVNITYKNKDKDKVYTGNVKVENLPVYATNYELFENYINFKKNIK